MTEEPLDEAALSAAREFVKSMVDLADGKKRGGERYWYWWAIRASFLAGVTWERDQWGGMELSEEDLKKSLEDLLDGKLHDHEDVKREMLDEE